MKLADATFDFVEGMLTNLNEFCRQPVSSYCKLHTTWGDHNLVAEDGSMITVMEHYGSIDLIGDQDWAQSVNRLLTGLNSRMSAAGHLIQVVKTYDPDKAHEEVAAQFEPSKITLKNFGINIDPVMDDWQESISRYCAAEHVLIVAWTRPYCLSTPELRNAKKNMRKRLLKMPFGTNIQNIGKVMIDLEETHNGFVSLLEETFKGVGMITETLDCHQALWWVRHELFPEFTSKDYKPCIPGDPLPNKLPDRDWDPMDMTQISYPPFKSQLFPREAEVVTRTTVKLGDHVHAPLSMELAPQDPMPFNRLFRSLINKKMPFRASFLFEGGKIPPGTGVKKQIAWLLAPTSFDGTNKQYIAALNDLNQRQLDGVTSVKFSASFNTWVRDDETKKSSDLLKKRRADLVSAIQAWGSCDCAEISGDPLLGVAATVPALMPSSPAPDFMPPLGDVLHMLPLTRMASIWREGSIILRTPDGKIMPYAQGTGKQAAWIDIGFGPMGTSKSVWLNTVNWGFLTQPGLSTLPYLTIIDVGGSSFGLISLLKSVLPKDQQHVAQGFTLRMLPEDSINPFDLPLGCEKPIDRHLSFLVNLCCLFATPLGESAPPNSIPGIARNAIEAAYEDCSQEMNPKLYVEGVDHKLDEIIAGMNMPIDANTTWREVTTFLFEQEMYREAGLAQRYAVPTLSDVAALVKTDRVSGIYKEDDTTEKTSSGSSVAHHFWKSLIETLKAYPILKYPTRFEIGDETKIVSIDLDEVANKGGADANRQTAVMMMLARQAAAARFFMKPSDLKFIPEKCQAYHQKKITQMQRSPKRLCYDEVHRFISDASIAKQFLQDLQTASRESRKWDLHIGLYSQIIEDIPPVILQLATSIFILGSGTEKAIEYIVKEFGLSRSSRNAISNLTPPKSSGATFFAMFRIKGHPGLACQLLTSTLGQQALWAFSSTKEERNVRDVLYEKIGITDTLKLLAERYPGGVKDIVDERKKKVTAKSATEATNDVIDEIIEEILEIAANQKRGLPVA